jgi:exopolysaccharide biosynthesis polyprenyl glycosylphosphotransferase
MSTTSPGTNKAGNRPPEFPIPMDLERLETHSAERKESRDRALLRFSIIAFVGDFCFAVLGLFAAWYIKFALINRGSFSLEMSELLRYYPQFILATFILFVMLISFKLYNSSYILRFRRNIVTILQVIFYWGLGFLSLSLALKVDPEISRLYVILGMVFIGGLLCVWRWAYASYLASSIYADQFKKRVLAVGWNESANKLYDKIYSEPRHPISIYSAVTTIKGDFEQRPPNEVVVEGDYAHLSELLSTRRFDAVLLVDFNLSPKQILELQHICMREMVEFMAIPSFYQVLLSRLEFDSVGGIPVMTGHNLPLSNVFNSMFKRAFDIAGALFGLTVFAPIIGYFCWRVYRESPGPVFYKQTRTGRNGKPFKIIKIRSMKLDAEKEGGAQWAKENDPRRLQIGEFMREKNIDELPQFWNVLKGEMSLVGPRPERPELIKNFKYDIDNYNLRHAVKPGVTGWAAINGWRGDTDLRTRIAFDIEYMEKWTIWFDIYIMLKTFGAGKNAY